MLESFGVFLHAWTTMQRLVRTFEGFVYDFDGGVDVPMEAADARRRPR
jgi:hypothetical protein